MYVWIKSDFSYPVFATMDLEKEHVRDVWSEPLYFSSEEIYKSKLMCWSVEGNSPLPTSVCSYVH